MRDSPDSAGYIEQDMLKEKVEPGNLSIDLTETLAESDTV